MGGCGYATAATTGPVPVFGPAPCGGIFPCTFIATFTGAWPHPGTAIPRDAAIAAAWMELNSRTRPGMKKHSMNPSSDGMPVQQKQR
jgi:hypothetical protein